MHGDEMVRNKKLKSLITEEIIEERNQEEDPEQGTLAN